MENIGKLLKKKRVDKGISLENIAQETKIQLSILRCLEEGNDPDIGGSAYNRVILISHAKAIGCSQAEINSLFQIKEGYNKVCEHNKENELFPSRLMLNKNILLGLLLLIVIVVLAFTIKSLYRRDNISFPRIGKAQTLNQNYLYDNEADPIAAETSDEPIQNYTPAEIEDRQTVAEITDVIVDEPELSADKIHSVEDLSYISDNGSDISVQQFIIEDDRDYLSEQLGIDTKRIIPLNDENSYVRLFVVGD